MEDSVSVPAELLAVMEKHFATSEAAIHWYKMGNSDLGSSPQSLVSEGRTGELVKFLEYLGEKKA